MEPTQEYPDGLVFIGGSDTLIEARQPGNTSEISDGLMPGHASDITSLDVNSKAGWLVSGSWDHTARLWQIGKWECIAVLEGHTQNVWAVLAFSDDLIVTGV